MEGADTVAVEPIRASPRRPLARRVALGFAALFALLLLALTAAMVWIDTAPGHRFIARQIGELEFENGLRIGVGRIEGSVYGKLEVHDLALSDPAGVFMVVPDAQMDWRPFAYLRNRIDIRSLTADLATLRRAPAFAPTPPSDQPLLPDLDIEIGSFRIARLVAEPAVAGRRQVAAIDGTARIADRRAQVKMNAATVAGGGTAGGDRLALVLDAVPERNRLDLQLDLRAPQDGVLAALAGLSEPLRLRVAGKGDWARWNGRAEADYGAERLARLALTARDGTFAIAGPTRIGRMFEGSTAALLGPETQIDVTGSLAKRRIDLLGNAASDAFRLNAKGVVDLSDNSFDGLQLGFVLLRPSSLAENLTGRGLRAMLRLDGAFATPTVEYTLNADRLVLGDMGLERFSASGKAEVDADAVMIPVRARAARVTGLDTVAGGTLANVTLAGDLAVDWPRILSDNMRLRSDRIDAGLVLLADTSKGFYSGAIDGKIDNYRIASVGVFNIDTDVDLERSGQSGFALRGRLRARSTSLFSEGVRSFLGGNVVAASDVRYGTDGIFRFSNLRLTAPDVRVTGGSGTYSPDGRLAVTANGITDAYGPVGVRLAGTADNIRATVTASRPDLGIGLADLEADIVTIRGGYRLDARGQTDYGPLTADVSLGMGDTLTLGINRADLGGIAFSGSLTRTAAGPFAGQLVAEGQGVNGLVRLGASGRYQQALVNLRAQDTVLPGPARLSVGSAIVDARIILFDQPQVIADAQVNRTSFDGTSINAARLKIDYRAGRGTAKLVAEGARGAPFRVAANAELRPDLWRAAVRGRVRGIAFATTSPARIIPGTDSYELLPTKVDFGRGSARLAGTYGRGIKIQSRLDSLDIAMANAFFPSLGVSGRATGSLDFEQPSPSAFPRADARLSIDNFTRTTAASVSQPVDVNFVGKLLPDGGEARAVLRRRGSVIGRMVASLRPLPPGAGTWTTRLLSAPLGGGIRYNGPADTLFSFTGLRDQSLAGSIGLAADFTGRVARPQLAGIVRGKGLTYENQAYGTRLANMTLAGRFAGSRLEIEQLTAAAGSGTVKASGFVSLAEAEGYPMDIAIEMDRARLARSGGLAFAATGDARLTKTAGQTALLSGTIALPEARYQLARQGAAQVPELSGVRFKPPRGPVRITGSEPAEPSPGLLSLVRLDLDVRAGERLYVSGMGLESEWRADLRIMGTSAEPRISGPVQLIRGTLGFAGRSFQLTDGRIGFTGGAGYDPTISLVATETIEDVRVNVNVTGRAFDPVIAFTSVPGLPQDEILARILFGSSIGNLSTIQAVQLAASLNSLRGGGGGLDPIGRLRSATGIDRLRILGADETAGRGTALAAGQYITDDIYIEFITDARGYTATQLEISLTPALSILTQAGGSGGTDINVQYRKNY
ncbi:translocation/assembly module TamB domain-containing protein [Parerythrobacter aurantius]|uniref:translocation/assembly module TamB domain-containing protein n=1 Tax=Parerythrobacter aurantius TaxID=3127706 RepID=UPI0032542C09